MSKSNPMYWEAEVEVTFKVKVEVVEDSLYFDKCDQVLLERAELIAKKKFDKVIPHFETKLVNGTVKGKSINYLSKEEQKSFERMMLAGKFSKP